MTPALNEYVNQTLGKVSKLIDSDPTVQCDVEVGRFTNNHHKGDVFKAEVHIVGNGIDAYATSENQDLNQAILNTREEILSKIRSVKGKRLAYVRKGGAKVKAMVKGLWPFKS